jgi:hypothetical protein
MVTPSTFWNTIQSCTPAYGTGATTVPAMSTVTAPLRHGPLNLALDTKNSPAGTTTEAEPSAAHAAAHALRNALAQSVRPSATAP